MKWTFDKRRNIFFVCNARALLLVRNLIIHYIALEYSLEIYSTPLNMNHFKRCISCFIFSGESLPCFVHHILIEVNYRPHTERKMY